MPPSPSSPFSRSVTKRTALAIALRRERAGNAGCTARSTVSRPLKKRPHPERVGGEIQSRTCAGGVRNSSATATLRGLRATGRSAISTSSGTITVRDQYDTFERWNGNHSGRCMISSGITGTARHGTWANRASWARVNTLLRSAPPAVRIACRARAMCGASASSPSAFRAKYAFTLADRLNAPSWNSGQPPCAPWIARR